MENKTWWNRGSIEAAKQPHGGRGLSSNEELLGFNHKKLEGKKF
jgi:hypothetical protein